MATTDFRLLGGAEIWREGRILTGIGSQKGRALLYYLVTTGQSHSRLALAGMLWGDLPELAALRNLRKTLFRLRKSLDDCLLITRHTVAMRPDAGYSADVDRFRSMTARQSGPDQWQSALALYRGDFLDGFYTRNAPEFETWMLAQREILHDRAVTYLQRLAHHLAARHDTDRAISYAKRVLELQPWQEEAHHLLMQLYAASGQVALAISQYEKCRHILAAEFGGEPHHKTQSLFAEIRRNHAQAPGAVVPSNLPHASTALVGRQRELDELQAQLQDPAVRLLTIAGIGGSGKTRLAQALASRLAHDQFPDGRFFISFEALQYTTPTDSEAVQAAIAIYMLSGMNVAIAPQPNPFRQVTAHLGRRRVLLVLDNFETLLLPELAHGAVAALNSILTHAPHVKLLVTSRQPLQLHAEWIYDLDGLPLPDGGDGPDEETASVRLFNETARRQSRTYDAKADRLAVYKICRLVGGLPLAIELAAGLVRHQHPSEIAAQTARSLHNVSAKWRDLPPRQRSLQATFEYTWRQLSEPEQQLLSTLSYMRRGFSREAAGAVARNLSHLLDSLAAKSLVRYDGQRFSLHEVILEFVQRKLHADAQASAAVAVRHAHYFLEQLERLEAGLVTGDDYPQCQALRPDLENIRTAWHWAVQNGDAQRIDKAARGLLVYFQRLGWLSEGITLLETAASALQRQAQRPSPALVNCLVQQGILASLSTDHVRAAGLAAQSAAHLHSMAGPQQSAEISFLQGQQHFLQGLIAHDSAAWATARNFLQQAAATFRRLDRPFDEARALFVVGNGWMGQRQWQNVLETGEQVITLSRQVGNRPLEAKTLATMAVAYSSQHDFERARACRLQARQLSAQIVWPVREEIVWLGMAADQALDAGYLDEAAAHIAQARPLVAQSGSMFYEDWNHLQNGHFWLQIGRHQEAREAYDRAQECAAKAEKLPRVASALICLCLPDYLQSQADRLAQRSQQLAAVAARLEDGYFHARAATWQGLAMLASRRLPEARAGFLQALSAADEEVCLCEARWGLLKYQHQTAQQDAALETAAALMASPLFANLPLLVTEPLLPFHIYHDCWQALLPLDRRQAETVRHIAARHLEQRLQRIENHGWRASYLQEATLGKTFPINPAQG